MDDKQKSKEYFNVTFRHGGQKNGYWSFDYRITAKELQRRNERNLIDIGCGNGAFLVTLPSRERFDEFKRSLNV